MAYKNKIVYGPVPSRRLGKWKNRDLEKCGSSLGINLSKIKSCSFDCIYCSCGKTKELSLNPQSNYSLKEIKIGLEGGFKEYLKKQTKIDYISFVGWTEPTLHRDFDKVVNLFFKIKRKYFPKIPTAIFTNSTTLDRRKVKESLKKFDRAFFKLDAGSNRIFRLINKPINKLHLGSIINNLAEFSKATNKVELSAMVLRSNYKDISSQNYINAINKIKPKDDKIYLCMPDWLRPINKRKGISLIPKKEIIKYVKDFIESFGYKVIILPLKRKGLHPLIKNEN